MSRIASTTLAAATILCLSSVVSSEAAPLPALSATQVGGPRTQLDQVGWRGGHAGYGHGAYAGAGYGRSGYNHGGYGRGGAYGRGFAGGG